MMLSELSGLETGGIICAMVVSTGALLVGVIGLNKKQSVEVSPQPVSVELTKEFVTKDECAWQHSSLEPKFGDFARKAELDRIERDVSALGRDRKSDAILLHEKINGVDRKVAGLEESSRMQNQQLSNIDAKINRLIERK